MEYVGQEKARSEIKQNLDLGLAFPERKSLTQAILLYGCSDNTNLRMLDAMWDQVQVMRRSVDRWVALNVSAQTQTTFIFVLIFVMVLHLVYTKRKLTREHLEKRAAEQQEKQEQKNSKKDK
eukprot:GFUD01031648.1.p1 GENE.GFUD01031648.1~~GFUD01031648.1.p1  ORF type:complete len:122 (-),score=35.22 GFUD01031648.1:552-917(-)